MAQHRRVTESELKRLWINELAITRWVSLALGILLVIHVPDYLAVKAGFDTPHAEEYAGYERMLGLALIAASGAAFVLLRAKADPDIVPALRHLTWWYWVDTAIMLAVMVINWLALVGGLEIGRASIATIVLIAVGFVTLLGRQRWTLTVTAQRWIAGMVMGVGLFFALKMPLRFVAYMGGPSIQDTFAQNADHLDAMYRPFMAGGAICLAFGIALWVWATRTKTA